MNTTHIRDNTGKPRWYIVDAQNHRLGRLATEIATILRGKNHVYFDPSTSPANHIIVINAKSVNVSGAKAQQKIYYRHSGRPGSLKTETFETLQKRLPNKIIENAVRKMLPKGALGRQIFKNLKVYADENHPHNAQKPIKIDL
uniref:Large ribosomal subunit protein uL13c n=1 Tax=Izziella formosana TaxID=1653389 RepID=A0A1G4NUT1_9FLOR|nr:Ribosomal protein L13 [Izziella formosana]SCW22428.1 Ribosomal protein L13 [Izziella formosana]